MYDSCSKVFIKWKVFGRTCTNVSEILGKDTHQTEVTEILIRQDSGTLLSKMVTGLLPQMADTVPRPRRLETEVTMKGTGTSKTATIKDILIIKIATAIIEMADVMEVTMTKDITWSVKTDRVGIDMAITVVDRMRMDQGTKRNSSSKCTRSLIRTSPLQ